MPQEVRDLEYLETLIDQHGIRGVLLMLADLCSLKADHVRDNWQDKALAQAWRSASNRIETASQGHSILALATAEGRRKDVRS